VFRSDNAGQSWAPIADVPKGSAKALIQHPFNNQWVFILTSDTTHYVTQDKGATWRAFKTPAKPSSTRSQLEFHSDEPGYILFGGEACKAVFFGLFEECVNSARACFVGETA
jgi:photosystem II stability/assembly factor-like uncharacterized protein